MYLFSYSDAILVIHIINYLVPLLHVRIVKRIENVLHLFALYKNNVYLLFIKVTDHCL